MCLELKENVQSKIAERNITCYKFVEKFNHSNDLTTPYKHAVVEIGKTYTSEINQSGLSINKALHSYKNKSNAVKDAKYFSDNDYRKTLVVKCRIPKGSVYYQGYFDGDLKAPSYASNCIEYLEIIEEYQFYQKL